MCRPLFAALILAGLFLASGEAALAARVSCDVILKEAQKTKKAPTVTLVADWGIVEMESEAGTCKEPVEVWRARGITWIKVTKGRKKSAAPAAKPQPAKPAAPKAEGLLPPAKTEPTPMQAPLPEARPATKPCDMALEDFWRQTSVELRGELYFLTKAVTIDQDGDSITDNVSFTLGTRGGGNLQVRYFARPGQVSGRTLPGLELRDDTVIPRLCFGKAEFGEPPEAPQVASQTFKTPDLAKQMERKKQGLPLVEPEEKPEGEEDKPKSLKFWIVVVAGSILFIVLVAIGAIVTRSKWMPLLKRGDSEDEDDDDEEGEEE